MRIDSEMKFAILCVALTTVFFLGLWSGYERGFTDGAKEAIKREAIR